MRYVLIFTLESALEFQTIIPSSGNLNNVFELTLSVQRILQTHVVSFVFVALG
jgi:hypothetical protein